MSTGGGRPDIVLRIAGDLSNFQEAIQKVREETQRVFQQSGRIEPPKLIFPARHVPGQRGFQSVPQDIKEFLQGEAERITRSLQKTADIGFEGADPALRQMRQKQREFMRTPEAISGRETQEFLRQLDLTFLGTQAGTVSKSFQQSFNQIKLTKLTDEAVQAGMLFQERIAKSKLRFAATPEGQAGLAFKEQLRKLDIRSLAEPQIQAGHLANREIAQERLRFAATNAAKEAALYKESVRQQRSAVSIDPLVQQGQDAALAIEKQIKQLKGSPEFIQAQKNLLERRKAIAQLEADPSVQNKRLYDIQKRLEAERFEGQVLAGLQTAPGKPKTREEAIAEQTRLGQRPVFFQLGDQIDKLSQKFLKSVNPVHVTNKQISDSAQLFLAMGGILAPLNSRLGMTVMQMGFSSFALGGVGAAFAAIAGAAGLAIAGLGYWNRKLNEFVNIAKESGNITLETHHSFANLNNQLIQFKMTIGGITASNAIKANEALEELYAEMGRGDSIFNRTSNAFSAMLNAFLQGGAKSLTGLSQLDRDLGFTETIQRIITAPLKVFQQGKDKLDSINSSLDTFVSNLTNLERTLLVSGDSLLRFSIQQSRAQMTREEIFQINQRNRASAVMSGFGTLNEMARAAAVEREMLFRTTFVPSIRSLESAATGIITPEPSRNIAEELTREQILQQKQQLVHLQKLDSVINALEDIRKNTSQPNAGLR